jgi:hypothetical protein
MNNLPSELVFDVFHYPYKKWEFGKDWKKHYYVNPNTNKCSQDFYTYVPEIQQAINKNRDVLEKLINLIESSDKECWMLAEQLLGFQSWQLDQLRLIIKQIL